MKNLETYEGELNQVVIEADQNQDDGSIFAWIGISMTVIFTSVQTYSLVYQGLADAILGATWIGVTALSGVALMEGSIIAWTFCRLYRYRSEYQRWLAKVASNVVMVILSVTSLAHFSMAQTGIAIPALTAALSFYAIYLLPVLLVGVGFIWKMLLEASPASRIRVLALQLESDFKESILKIREEQNKGLIESYQKSLDSPRVQEARDRLFEECSIRHAEFVTSFVPQRALESANRPDEEEEALQGEVVQ
jgi:hypothetical protein